MVIETSTEAIGQSEGCIRKVKELKSKRVKGLKSKRVKRTFSCDFNLIKKKTNMNNSIEIYRSQDGSIQLNVKLENETVWLTQSQMAELFGVDRTSIVRHIRNIYKSEELEEFSTCAKNAQVRFEGQRQIVREIPYYNLDMIISLGYRIKSISYFSEISDK